MFVVTLSVNGGPAEVLFHGRKADFLMTKAHKLIVEKLRAFKNGCRNAENEALRRQWEFEAQDKNRSKGRRADARHRLRYEWKPIYDEFNSRTFLAQVKIEKTGKTVREIRGSIRNGGDAFYVLPRIQTYGRAFE